MNPLIKRLDAAVLQTNPFPFFALSDSLEQQQSLEILNWLEKDAPWKIRRESFYEQYEFSFLDVDLPEEIAFLNSVAFITEMRKCIEDIFNKTLSNTICITAHKLVSGQHIKIHNDYISGQETHRLLIQLNRQWDIENGGQLMFFSGPEPESITHVFNPTHSSVQAFEISPYSYHAVSEIKKGHRFTLVYSFYQS